MSQDEDKTRTRNLEDPEITRLKAVISDHNFHENSDTTRVTNTESHQEPTRLKGEPPTSDNDLELTNVEQGNAFSLSQDNAGIYSTGSVIRDRFELLESLGTGGMGCVFRAIDRRKKEANDENPYIAIKLLNEDFQSHPQAFVTLQRETKKTHALAHPNIVTVFDFDRDGNTAFMTMEELSGNSLDKLIHKRRGRPFERKQAISIILGIARGLNYAHSKGIIHSDLKPGNIFISENGVVKLLDFGIARVAEGGIYSDNFDAASLGALTPAYASVEMLEDKPADKRDDIYALGIIACELLTGSHPYRKQDAANAKKMGLSPTFNGLSWVLKHVLAKAVELRIEKRISDCSHWISWFEFAIGGYRKWVAGLLTGIVIAITASIYLSKLAYVTPLEALPVEQRTAFSQHINEAEMAMSFGDINGALFYVDKAFTIHSQNEELENLIEKVILTVAENVEINTIGSVGRKALYDNLVRYQAFSSETTQHKLKAALALESLGETEF